MFDDTIAASWDERSRRGVTTLTSFAIQAMAVGVLLILPLLRPSVLPMLRQVSAPVSLGDPGAPPAPRPQMGTGSGPSTSPAIVLRPSFHLQPIVSNGGDEPAPAIPGCCGSPSAPVGWGMPNGVFNAGGSGVRPSMPVVPAPPPPPTRVSHMSEGDLIHKVVPTYPPLARSARIQGQVVLQAIISKQGIIENLRVVYGHPMLAPAAIEAVRQWRYRPYILNNEPVEVETQITVNFSLSGD